MGEGMSEAGAVIMGRISFDQIYSEQGWIMPDGTTLPWPVVVMQSQVQESVKKGHTHFYFVSDGILRCAMASSTPITEHQAQVRPHTKSTKSFL